MIQQIIDDAIADWTSQNTPLGEILGYPKCCIHAFNQQPPIVLKLYGVNGVDRMRLAASRIDGKYTGFIPCASHAIDILQGKITLASLIENRDPLLPPFPNAFQRTKPL